MTGTPSGLQHAVLMSYFGDEVSKEILNDLQYFDDRFESSVEHAWPLIPVEGRERLRARMLL